MPTLQPVAVPDIKSWEFHDKTGFSRTFEQSELTIDGEVRLIQLASKTVQHLNTQGFPWEQVSSVITEQGAWDWVKAQDLLTLAIAELPELVAESTCIMFDLSPFDDDRRRNLEYEKDKAFIRKSINFTRWVEILQTFVDQNDYQRLARPFGLALTKAMELGLTSQTRLNQSETSSPDSTYLSRPDTEGTEEASPDV